MWNLKQQQTNKTLIDTDNRRVVARGERVGEYKTGERS